MRKIDNSISNRKSYLDLPFGHLDRFQRCAYGLRGNCVIDR